MDWRKPGGIVHHRPLTWDNWSSGRAPPRVNWSRTTAGRRSTGRERFHTHGRRGTTGRVASGPRRVNWSSATRGRPRPRQAQDNWPGRPITATGQLAESQDQPAHPVPPGSTRPGRDSPASTSQAPSRAPGQLADILYSGPLAETRSAHDAPGQLARTCPSPGSTGPVPVGPRRRTLRGSPRVNWPGPCHSSQLDQVAGQLARTVSSQLARRTAGYLLPTSVN